MKTEEPKREVKLELPVAASGASEAPAASIDLDPTVGIAAAREAGVALTHPDRVVYPDAGLSKAQIVAYYARVADRMLPHLTRRPLSLVRHPPGRGTSSFFQKHATEGFPSAFKAVPIAEADGETADYMYVEGLDGVIAGVQMSTLEFHIWGSHIATLEKPDRIVFDLDPDEGLDFGRTRDAAREVKERLVALGLISFAMVTGGKGIHVVAPLTPRRAWPEIKEFCRGLAEAMAHDAPDQFTTNVRKASRGNRIFIDYLRNERGATAIVPYSTRARNQAACAIPVSWAELGTLTRSDTFSCAGAAARASQADPWSEYFEVKQAIGAAALRTLRRD